MDSCWHLGSAARRISLPWLWNSPAPFLGQFYKHMHAELPGTHCACHVLVMCKTPYTSCIDVVQALHSLCIELVDH